MRLSIIHECAAIVALLALWSCTEAVTEPGRTVDEVTRLHVTYDYPKLASSTVSFWAVKGRVTGADLVYHARPGATDSAKFVEFRLPSGALDRRPDGSTIANGDSVLITLTAPDANHMRIDFQPSGLRFTAGSLPTLKIFWTACGDDVNYDGVVDSVDAGLIDQFAIWRQESATTPWFRLPSVVVKGSREISTQPEGFTGYAASY